MCSSNSNRSYNFNNILSSIQSNQRSKGREKAMKISKREEEEGEESEERRTIVVGVKMDAESRELLTWALVKVARAGDRVVALHVIPSSEVFGANGRCSSLLSIVKAFDSVLAVYDGFCNLKQIDLKLKLCRGSSTKKVLIRETISYEATHLIVGISKNHRGIRSASTSVAKNCSKKLPKDCSIFAVNNGKIVYQRESTENRNSSKVQIVAIKGQQTMSFNASRSSFQCLPTTSKPRSICEIKIHDDSRECDRDQNCAESKKNQSLALVPVKKTDSPPNTIRSLIVRELNEGKPGWPLLRKTFLTNNKHNSKDKSKVSVVQWAMRLPSRSTATSITHSPQSSLEICDEVMEISKELRSLQEKYSSICRLFSYEELKHATSNFSAENLIGRGGSSQVYKGCLASGKELAVKLLKPSEDVMKAFVSEIDIVTTLHHKNIISLVGFCFENDNLILVYDFLSRGSLEEILHGNKDNTNCLGWIKRYNIAVGIAEALGYLHDGGSAKPVIHRDVKSSNILVSDDFEPQLADFGLSLWASSSSMRMTCNDVAGTFGYLAPEYFMHGKVNEKIDVYAFGVVLLELLSGRKPVNSQCPKGEESVVMWARKVLQDGKMKQLVDPCLGDTYDNDQLERMILAASICIRQAPRSRPRMALVMKLLHGEPDVLKWARSEVNSIQEFNVLDEEVTTPNSNIQSHINLAFLDVEDDTLSVSSVGPSIDFITSNTSLEDYLKGRWSRSSSFD